MKEVSKNKQAAIVLCLIIVAGVWACSGSGDKSTTATQKEQVEQEAPKPEEAAQSVSDPSPKNLSEAIERYRSDMSDTTNSLSPGAAEMTVWAASNGLRWKDLMSVPSTKAGLVRKDAGEERGKRICVNGPIVEIAADTAGGNKVYQGGIADAYSGDIYRFVAVGSTGDLMEQSNASFCGIVIGTMDYSNSAGGATHAVQLVGMFKLPSNMKTI